MIRIADYGLGNCQAFLNVFKRLGIEAARAKEPAELEDATHLILPGVGAFDHAMTLFNNSGLREPITMMATKARIPILGVCVGMQIMAERSEEGKLDGLAWFPGTVRDFKGNPKNALLPNPHMGWNDVIARNDSKLLANFTETPRFYFLHSYYFECEVSAHMAAVTEYGEAFASMIARDNFFGVQCHPEKSHHFGAQLLKNFAAL